MKWFPGSMNEAVTTSKQKKAIFVAFIEGKDDTSAEASRALEDQEISSRLESSDFVAVRLEGDGASHKFFEQIYKTVPVPSLFFIGLSGEPIEIVTKSFEKAELTKKIDAVLQKVGKSGSSSSASLLQSERNVESSVSSGATSSSPEAAGSSGAATSQCSLPAAEKEPSTEEKLERAKQLIELQRLQKMEKEKEEEKRREIERRKVSKDIQSAQQKQRETELKLAYDERLREKAAEAEAREKVLRQIAQDKLERKQREASLQKPQTVQQQNQQERGEDLAGNSASQASIARIQFRLPSGSAHMGKFEASSTLGELRSYVTDSIELPFRKFAMSTTFPRRDLTSDDDEKSLSELELVPTAVILILPVKNPKESRVVNSSSEVGFVSRFIWAFFTPILSVYNYVMGFFAPAARPPAASPNDSTVGRQAVPERIPRGQPSGPIPRNLFGGPATTIRSQGNIHRLHSGGDDNDENNTWNGNSTQQM